MLVHPVKIEEYNEHWVGGWAISEKEFITTSK